LRGKNLKVNLLCRAIGSSTAMSQMRNVLLIIAIAAGMAIATVAISYLFDMLPIGAKAIRAAEPVAAALVK
jgi:hypothetical protein